MAPALAVTAVATWVLVHASGVHATVAAVVLGGAATTALADPVTWGVAVGLVVGKTVGVAGTTGMVAWCTGTRPGGDLGAREVLGLGLLAGIGFTVSLLIGELAFGAGSAADAHVTVGVLVGSVLAMALAAPVLRGARR